MAAAGLWRVLRSFCKGLFRPLLHLLGCASVVSIPGGR